MRVRELTERLKKADPDAEIEILDVSGRGLKLHISGRRWAIQVERKAVFIRVDDYPSGPKAGSDV